MRFKTGIAVLTINGLLVLLIGLAVRDDAQPATPAPAPLVQASITVPEPQEPVVVEGALSSNTRGWSRVSQAVVGATKKGVRPELVDAYWLAVSASPVECHLTVSLLAAIGQVESGNLAGHQLDSDNRAVPEILGPVLDGKKYDAIEDTDDGKLDHDLVWDRALGPMQFVPSSWRVAGVDMDGDGRRDPQDIDDAAGTAMVYLCSGDRDLASPEGLREAVLSYNHSASYVRLVLAWKTYFDRNPLTGWTAWPIADAWEVPAVGPGFMPQLDPADVPTPTRSARPLPAAKPGAAPGTPTGTTVTPTPSSTPSTPGTPKPTPTTSAPASPTPTAPTPAPTGAGTPATDPEPKPDPTPTPDPKPDPTPEPLPLCPVPAPADPSGSPSPTKPSETPAEPAPVVTVLEDGSATVTYPDAETIPCELPPPT